MEQAEAESPGARAVMSLAAFYAPGNIPEELFKQSPDIYPPALQPVVASESRLTEAVSALDHLSLADFDPAERTFSVHRLVQAAVRDALGSTEAETEWIAAAVMACAAAYPGQDFQHWQAYERLLPHARTAGNIAPEGVGLPLASLLNQAGFYLYNRAAYAEALPLYERALAIWEKALGPGHPSTKRVSANLAAPSGAAKQGLTAINRTGGGGVRAHF